MRPCKLTMTAFGPYAGKTIIDFRELNQGVYLITGDTGSGKTTIFDAIVFALYGEGSGSGRNSEMFHSDYVDKFTDTEVELEFLCRNKEYKVIRTIHYKKKREDGGVGAISKNAVLYCGGELPIEKETAVNRKITEILGLDEKQFRQIVMLAQGEFRKFLESKSDAREQILGKLFDNRIYVDFQNRLKEAAEELRKEREKKEQEMEFYLSDGVTLQELMLRIAEAEEKKARLEEKIGKENENIEALQKRLVRFREHNHRIDELKHAQKSYDAVRAAANEKAVLCMELQKEKQQSAKNLPEIDDLKLRIRNIEKCREDYDKLEKLLKSQKRVLEELKISEKTQNEAAEKIRNFAAEQKNLQISLGPLENVEVDIAKAGHEMEKQRLKKKQQRELKEKLQNYHLQCKVLIEKQEKWHVQQADYEEAARRYLEKNRLFLAGQAGVLAQTLRAMVEEQERGICPVCGTLVGKEQLSGFAKMEEGVPAKEDVEKARAVMEEEQEYAAEYARECEVLKNTIEMSKNDTLNFACDLFGEEIGWDILTDSDYPEQFMREQNERYQKKQEELTELEHQLEEKKALEKRLTELENILETAKDTLEKSKSSFAELEKSSAVIRTEIQNLKGKLAFETKERADTEKCLLEARKNALEQAVAGAEEKLSRCREELSNLQGRQEALQRQKEMIIKTIGDAIMVEKWPEAFKEKHMPTEETETELNEKTAAKNELKKEREKLLPILEAYRNSFREVQKLQKELDETKTAYENLWKLSALANGQSGEGGKYSFSRYVLGAFFEEIIEQANNHLNRMTGGKYELIRREEAGRKNESAGLGMVIFDAYTGECRDTASISGGESFQVSLSLALGLSDVVRSRSTGYTLDTMFIDEGFGSLDEQALEQAMEVLHELSKDSRQIGIISHVGKLSENISQKIYVKRSPKGSSVQIIKK